MEVKQKTQTEGKQLYVGWGIASPLVFNPNREKVIELLEVKEEYQDEFKEPNYLGEKDGHETCRITLYVKNVKTENVDRISFFLKNKEVVKEETGNIRYINQLGVCQSVKNETDLFSSFTNFEYIGSWKQSDGTVTKKYVAGSKPNDVEIVGKKVFRPAIEGEEKLMNWLKGALLSVDYKDMETNLLLNMKKLFAGDFSELNALIKGNLIGNIIVPYTVKTDDSNGEIKEYQDVHNGYVLAEAYMRFLRAYDMSKLYTLHENYRDSKKRDKMKPLELFIAGTTNTDYPIKEYYINQEMAEYNPDANPVASNNAVVAGVDDDLPF